MRSVLRSTVPAATILGLLILLAGVPFLLRSECTREAATPVVYHITGTGNAEENQVQEASRPLFPLLSAKQPNQHERYVATYAYDVRGKSNPNEEWLVSSFLCDTRVSDCVIAAFTIMLAVSTVLLWRQTQRAADVAEKALLEIERPWFAVEAYHVRKDTPSDLPNAVGLMIGLQWRNVGKAPALVDECTIEFIEAERLPTRPSYRSPIQLQAQRAVRADGGFTTKELGPSPDIGSDYLEGIKALTRWVAFGRLTYREMSGTQHVTGYAVELLFPSGAIEVGGDAYNYFT